MLLVCKHYQSKQHSSVYFHDRETVLEQHENSVLQGGNVAKIDHAKGNTVRTNLHRVISLYSYQYSETEKSKQQAHDYILFYSALAC